jgi:hypothetical protein
MAAVFHTSVIVIHAALSSLSGCRSSPASFEFDQGQGQVVTLRRGVTNSTRADISPPGQGMYSFVFYACIQVSGPLFSAWESNHFIWRGPDEHCSCGNNILPTLVSLSKPET